MEQDTWVRLPPGQNRARRDRPVRGERGSRRSRHRPRSGNRARHRRHLSVSSTFGSAGFGWRVSGAHRRISAPRSGLADQKRPLTRHA